MPACMCLNVRIRFNSLTLVHYKLQFADGRRGHSGKKVKRWNKFTSFQLFVLTGADVYLTFPRQERIWQIVPAFALDVGVLNWGMAAAVDGEWRKFARLASLLSQKKAINKKNSDTEIFLLAVRKTQLGISFLFC